MPKEGMSRREYRTAKFGSWEQSLALDARMKEVGATEGIVFDFDRMERTPNTFDCHQLGLHLVQSRSLHPGLLAGNLTA
ncbi:MAG: hypothetical protein C0467_24210 [Planctomycetaceae bacterium]|nr:hypothetical protein [Planctomycetaceae bacterium]